MSLPDPHAAVNLRLDGVERACLGAMSSAIACHEQVAALSTSVEVLKKMIAELTAAALVQQAAMRELESQIAHMRGPLH